MSLPTSTPNPYHIAEAASHYTFDQLAKIYSDTRKDYVVPMPMNGKRLATYVQNYDVDLWASIVSLDSETKQPTGIGMLGIRDNRGWITRLGVMSNLRRRKTGRFLMEQLLDQARKHQLDKIQLEVIKDNDPAHRLFHKFGFKDTRELLIIRRAPVPLDPKLKISDTSVEPLSLSDSDVLIHLANREGGASWVEETRSLLNTGQLDGYKLALPSGETGWLVFQNAKFHMGHFVLSANASSDMIRALLWHVHTQNSHKDTKIENLPVTHPAWAIYQEFGYHVEFRRIEMLLEL